MISFAQCRYLSSLLISLLRYRTFVSLQKIPSCPFPGHPYTRSNHWSDFSHLRVVLPVLNIIEMKSYSVVYKTSFTYIFWDLSMLLLVSVIHFTYCWVAFHYMTTLQFVYWFSCLWIPELFPVRSYLNKTAIGILVRSVMDIFFYLLGNYLGMGFWGQMVRIHLTVKKLPTVFRSGCSIFHPCWQLRSSSCSVSPTNLLAVLVGV